MPPAISLPASTFRKVLKGFEIGGLPYTDVQFHLKRLLAQGTSPEELQEVLRRCELITPLPDYAHAEVLRLLEEARDRAAPQIVEAALEAEPGTEEESTGNLAAELRMTRKALAAEQAKAQEISRALAERIGSEQAARARSEDVRRESEHYQGELRNARNLLSTRDAVIAQMRVSLDECNAKIAALRKEHAAASTTLESRGKNVVQLQTDLEASRTRAATLGAELAAAPAALATEQRRREQIVPEEIVEEQIEPERSVPERTAGPDRIASPDLMETPDSIQIPVFRDIARASVAALRAAPVVEITDFLPSPKPIKRWKPGALVRVIGVGAAIVALALVTGLFVPNPAAPVKAPEAVAAAIPQAGTVLHDCPTCPRVIVLPPGRFEQGSKYTDTAASPFEK